MRSMVEGAAAASIDPSLPRLRNISESGAVAAPSTAFGGPPPPRFAQGRMSS